IDTFRRQKPARRTRQGPVSSWDEFLLGAAAALALVWAMACPAVTTAAAAPVPYQSAGATGLAAESAAPADSGSDGGAASPTAEPQPVMAEEADWTARVNLSQAGGGGATGNDSLGCRPIPMRTMAVDPRYIPRRTRLFIPETVGMRMPDGTLLDGYWYASDTG